MKHQTHTCPQECHSHVDHVVVPAEKIAVRVAELADQINRIYQGEQLTILAVMTGSLVFLADLVRYLHVMVRVEVTSVRSYPDDATRSLGPRFRLPPADGVAGRHVLLLDDILDSGATLKLLLETVEAMGPASLRSCVLLQKSRPDLPDRVQADFVCLDIDDDFVVGYGLDFNNLYRNLPDICLLKRDVFSSGGGPAT